MGCNWATEFVFLFSFFCLFLSSLHPRIIILLPLKYIFIYNLYNLIYSIQFNHRSIQLRKLMQLDGKMYILTIYFTICHWQKWNLKKKKIFIFHILIGLLFFGCCCFFFSQKIFTQIIEFNFDETRARLLNFRLTLMQ